MSFGAFRSGLARDGATRGLRLPSCGSAAARRVAQAGGFVLRRQFEQSFQRAGRGIHGRVRIAEFAKALGNGEDGEVGGLAIGNFVPVKRRGDAGIGKRAHGIGGASGAVFGVLVVIEEDAVALLFPPFRTGDAERGVPRRGIERGRRGALR